MKMAKASEADLAMAMKLANYLDAIEREQMPDELSEDPESIEWLDHRDPDQTEKLIGGLRRLLNQGSISRVIWGMAVICDPVNKCIDPNADTIEHHPDLVKAVEQRDALLAALQNSDHSPKCAVRDRDAFDDREPCTCGRDAAIAEAQP